MTPTDGGVDCGGCEGGRDWQGCVDDCREWLDEHSMDCRDVYDPCRSETASRSSGTGDLTSYNQHKCSQTKIAVSVTLTFLNRPPYLFTSP